MLKNLAILALLVITVAIGSQLGELFEQPTKPPAQERSGPDYAMTRFATHVMNENGTVQYKMTGAQLRHFDSTDQTEIIEPRIRAFSDKEPPWSLSAQTGTYRRSADEFDLKGNIVMSQTATNTSKSTEVRSEQLLFYPDAERAETNRQVQITKGADRFTATGLRASYGNDPILVLLKDVKGYHAPSK